MNYSPPRIVAALWALVVGAYQVVVASGLPLPGKSSRADSGWPDVVHLFVAGGCLAAVAIALLGSRRLLVLVGTTLVVLAVAMLIAVLASQGRLGGWLASVSPEPLIWWKVPVVLVGGVAFVVSATRRWSLSRRLDRDQHISLDR